MDYRYGPHLGSALVVCHSGDDPLETPFVDAPLGSPLWLTPIGAPLLGTPCWTPLFGLSLGDRLSGPCFV